MPEISLLAFSFEFIFLIFFGSSGRALTGCLMYEGWQNVSRLFATGYLYDIEN
jgi:hypothetical protein